MNKIFYILSVALIGSQIGCSRNAGNSNNDDPFSVFDKQADVFGVQIYGTPNTGWDKVLHAATIMAEYLDNDEDGLADNAEVVKILSHRKATLIMFRDEEEQDELFQWNKDLINNYELQNLFHRETHPDGASRQVFDATLEEVHHLILFGGYAHAYPEIFGLRSGTAVALAMDYARGGHFKEIPDTYPELAWYSYDDETCNYDCMIIEYLYWAHTSLLGAQDYPWRLEEIKHEWRLNSAEKLMAVDTAIYKILTDPQYALPSVLPDGIYQGGEIKIERK